MKKIIIFIVFLVSASTLMACTSGSVATTVEQTSSSTSISSQATDTSSSLPTSSDALADNEEVVADPSDFTWDNAIAVEITLNGDSISTNGAGVTVDGGNATISQAGTYLLNGTLTDGQIIVDTQDEALVKLVLNGVNLSNSSSAPIYILDAEKVILILVDGSTNTVSDASTYVYASAEEDEPNAAIFSKADMSIGGNGSLTVMGNSNDGITSKDGLVIASGEINVTAVDDGIRGKDYVVIKDGTIRIDSGGDGLKSDKEEDTTRGFVSIAAGSLEINAGGDAISAASDVIITGGEFNLTTAGGSTASLAEGLSAKGIKGAVSVVIDSGNFNINAADDGLHSNGSISINNGTFNIDSGDDGMHADATLTINNGTLTINQSYEGLESAIITINDGNIQISSSDDGINVAGGRDGSGMQFPGMQGGQGMQFPGTQGRPGAPADPNTQGGQITQGRPDAFNSNSDYFLYIHGGTIAVNAYGDGLDINGSMEMSGGTLLVSGPTDQGNAALDYDGTFTISGGLLIATGSSGMAMSPSTTSSQNSMIVFFESAVPAGTLVHLQDSSGEELFTFEPAKNYQSLVYSSPLLTQGETHTLYLGGSAKAASIGGLVEVGTYTPGEVYSNIAISGTVTQLGNGGGMGGGRGPRP